MPVDSPKQISLLSSTQPASVAGYIVTIKASDTRPTPAWFSPFTDISAVPVNALFQSTVAVNSVPVIVPALSGLISQI